LEQWNLTNIFISGPEKAEQTAKAAARLAGLTPKPTGEQRKLSRMLSVLRARTASNPEA
jgi:hypothetical protein